MRILMLMPAISKLCQLLSSKISPK